MAILRAILNFLLKIRTLLQHYGAKLFEKVRDPETGKVIGLTPSQLRKLLIVSGLVFFVGVIASQIFKDTDFTSGGGEAYKNELTPKNVVGLREQEYPSPFGDDPLNALQNATDPLGGLTGDGIGNNDLANIGGPGARPTEAECLDLMEKMKANIPLNNEEKKKFETCLDENIGGFTAEEIALARQLLNDNLSAEERELLRKMLAGEIEEGSDDALIAKNLLAGGEAADLAKGALAALAAGNDALFDALMKSLRGEDLTDQEEQLVADFRQALGQGPGVGEVAGGTLTERLQNLTEDVANRENAITDLKSQISEAQIAAAKAGEKLAKGLALTPEEQAAIQRLADLQRQLKELQDLQNQRKQLLAELMQQLRNSLARASATINQIYPSGTSVEFLGEDECKNPTPFVAKKKPRGKQKFANRTKKEIWLDPSGRPLSPDQMKIIKLARLKKAAQEQEQENLLNPGNDVLDGDGNRVNAEQLVAEGGTANVEVESLFVYKNQAQKQFQLTPDMRIPAVLDSQILVSDKGRGQIIRVRILDDIYDPATNTLIIPKNSVATGTTQGFDADIGMMDIAFDKVVVGSGKILDVKFNVGSADGTMGLKGQIRDTRGKFLLGAFITSFSAGALNWFSQSVITPFQEEEDAQNALIGASLGGGAEVMTQIAELYAADLQNAAKIFWVPKGVPIVLFPSN